MKKSDRFIWLIMLTACVVICFLYTNARVPAKGSSLCINEIMGRSSEYLVDHTTYAKKWIELYNGTEQDINLAGYGLSTIKERPYQLCFTQVTIPANGYLVVQALGEEGPEVPILMDVDELRTDFDINANGGKLFLTDADGKLIDEVQYGDCIADVAYGRSPDGGEMVLFKQSSRGFANGRKISRKQSAVTFDHTVVFSHEEGYYPEAFDLELSAPHGESILYTLDSSEPDINSKVYKGPIRIYDRSEEENRYAGISTEAERQKRIFGETPVKKAMVVRTRLLKDGHLSETITTKTYWIGKSSGLLTLSLVTDPSNLFDFREGILVPGMIYGYFVHGKNVFESPLGNYSMRGAMSVREASISFFEDGKQIAWHEGGIRVGGGILNAGRGPVKRLYLSSSILHEPDGSVFPEELFPGIADGKGGFSELRLRNSLNFVSNAMTDAFVNRVVKGVGLGEQEERPVSVYIDGEYWGVSYLVEALDEEYISRHFQLEEGNISLLNLDSRSQKYEVEAGGKEMIDEYINLLQYGVDHDMADPDHYDYICRHLDIDNYIKNYIIRIFFVCTDWPDNNVRVFKAIDPDGTPYGDGRWRHMLFDNDYTSMEYQFNMFTYVMGEEKRPGRYNVDRPVDGTYELFGELLKNKTFRDQFRMQYEEYKKTIFDKEHMQAVLDELMEEIGPEFEENASRWSSTSSIIGKAAGILGKESGDVDQLQVEKADLRRMEEFIRERETYMDEHLEAMFARYEK